MKKEPVNYPVIFTHAPRTGGTTLSNIIKRQYKKNEIFSFYVRSKGGFANEALDEFVSLPEEQKRKFKLLGGHVHFGLHRNYDKSTYTTLFRDPVKRIVSLYSYALTKPNFYLHSIVVTKKLTLKDFVSMGLSPELNNGQTRLISGVENIAFGSSSRDMLDKAKKNLDEYFPAFGITERFDETVILMKNHFNWFAPYYTNMNTSPLSLSSMKVSDDVLELIREYNKLDIELYQYACQRFQTIIDKQDKRFHQDLERFKKRNILMQKWGSPKRNYFSFNVLKMISGLKK